MVVLVCLSVSNIIQRVKNGLQLYFIEESGRYKEEWIKFWWQPEAKVGGMKVAGMFECQAM